ncbi:hypothetical protein C4573_03430 [Candidatus Woesearchaeota archaeon]|nr:MAG: hypothetical protein C4573_03430 [Candidatus Woesearchaeota archaeon]
MATKLEVFFVVLIALISVVALALFLRSYGHDLLGEAFTGTKTCGCTDFYRPVCGDNLITYDNACVAVCNRASVFYEGVC